MDVPPRVRPRLYVIVDTEEEFDWAAPFNRQAVSVTAIGDAWRLQQVVEPLGVTPTYVIDYPVAVTPSSVDALGAFAARGTCDIGAHLHPWVNPPHEETPSGFTSFACNLDPALESAKIETLTDAIRTSFGRAPVVYKAGRYGFAPSSAATLERLGYTADVSVNPHMDFTSIGGPSFAGMDARPSWFGQARRLLELPCTTGFVGLARRAGEALHRVASRPALTQIRAVGILARAGLLNRVMLSPEGSTLDEMCALTRALYRDGVRTFSLTFHSPSLTPGCTPYVRSVAQRDAFLVTIARYLEFFLGEMRGVPSTPRACVTDVLEGFAT